MLWPRKRWFGKDGAWRLLDRTRTISWFHQCPRLELAYHEDGELNECRNQQIDDLVAVPCLCRAQNTIQREFCGGLPRINELQQVSVQASLLEAGRPAMRL